MDKVQKGFLEALKKNEDDTETRLVYADWLDEQGQHDEADRMRKWKAAKEALRELCRKDAQDEYKDDMESYYIGADALICRAMKALKDCDSNVKGDPTVFCGASEYMCDRLRHNSTEFWKNISIVTGLPIPEDLSEKVWFSCGC